MIVSLYTSRVVLQILGIVDYGLYAVAGSMVGIFSSLNLGLVNGASRFLTFELGKGDFEKLKTTFSVILSIHFIVAIIVVVLAETAGLWFFYHRLSIPSDRMNAALWVYHISIFTTIISITQVPYNASIISHEKMNIFAYASIVEVLAKLGIVFLLQFSNIDKLIIYSIFLCLIQIGMALFYRLYCISRFNETHYEFIFDRRIIKSVMTFSGWSLFANWVFALSNHGTTVITSMFFGPSVVTARAISVQVNMAANQFVQNFRTAVNPQIVKRYATGDFTGSKQLLLISTKISFFLMLLMGLPIILLAEPLLQLWLGQVPAYTCVFLQLIIVQSLFLVFDVSFFMPLYAKGRLRENALICSFILFIQFPVVYLLFRIGYSPVVLFYIGIIVQALLGLVIKPILICKIVNYTLSDIMSVFIPCMKVCLIAIPIPVLLNYYLEKNLFNFLIICIVSIICVLVVVFYIGLDRNMRYKIIRTIKEKLGKTKKGS